MRTPVSSTLALAQTKISGILGARELVWNMSPAMTPDVYVLNVRDFVDRLVHTSIWFESLPDGVS